MIRIRRSAERGHINHGWLDARHTFSFGGYQDPEQTGFGVLRVINQDIIQPGAGFPTHGHEEMEIITYVLDGVLDHRDSMGNGSRIRPGDVQVMSAGIGLTHSEFNGSQETTTELLQIWILPAEPRREPRYAQRAFSEDELRDRLVLVVSRDGADGSLEFGQDATLRAGRLTRGTHVEYAFAARRSGWIQVARGLIGIGSEDLRPGDGAALTGEDGVRIVAGEDAEILLFDLPEEEL